MNQHTFTTSASGLQLRIHRSGRYWTDEAKTVKYFSENGKPINPDGTPVAGEFDLLQYVVFAGQTYYPGGGWDDFVGSWDDPNDAIKSIATDHYDWIQVVDIKTGQIIHEGAV